MLLSGKGTISTFQREILVLLSGVPDANSFYLAGGTALAEFHFGHRKSFDIDFFSGEEKLIQQFSKSFDRQLRTKLNLRLIRNFSTFVEYEASCGSETVRVQFAHDSPFSLEKPVMTDIGVYTKSYMDAITDKFLTYFGRAAHRDAVDLYFILGREDFWKLCEKAKIKDEGFDLYWMAAALKKIETFSDDLAQWQVQMLVPLDAKALKKSFLAIADEIMKQIGPK